MRVVGLCRSLNLCISVFFCKKSRLNLMIYKQKLMLAGTSTVCWTLYQALEIKWRKRHSSALKRLTVIWDIDK